MIPQRLQTSPLEYTTRSLPRMNSTTNHHRHHTAAHLHISHLFVIRQLPDSTDLLQALDTTVPTNCIGHTIHSNGHPLLQRHTPCDSHIAKLRPQIKTERRLRMKQKHDFLPILSCLLCNMMPPVDSQAAGAAR